MHRSPRLERLLLGAIAVAAVGSFAAALAWENHAHSCSCALPAERLVITPPTDGAADADAAVFIETASYDGLSIVLSTDGVEEVLRVQR